FAAATAVVETNRSRASAHAAASRIGTILGIEAALSSRVVLAGRGQVSWLPGLLGRAFPGRVGGAPVAGARSGARDLLDPVTVAGPRRFRTGLPLTTDRIGGESTRRGGEPAPARRARPPRDNP